MSNERDTVYERLHILRKKLDNEGSHVRTNTVTRAIDLLDDVAADLTTIATIGEGSTTGNSLTHVAKIARSAIAKIEGAT